MKDKKEMIELGQRLENYVSQLSEAEKQEYDVLCKELEKLLVTNQITTGKVLLKLSTFVNKTILARDGKLKS